MHIFDDNYLAFPLRVVIFDLDGTLSDGTHRLHKLPTKDLHLTSSWLEFNRMAAGDTAFTDNIAVMNAMFDAGLYVIILTGRSGAVREETVQWLEDNGCKYHMLEMRGAEDNRKDTVIKEEFLRKVGVENIIAAWDDSPQVINHFRSLGITTYQVVDYGCTKARTDLHSNGVEKL